MVMSAAEDYGTFIGRKTQLAAGSGFDPLWGLERALGYGPGGAGA